MFFSFPSFSAAFFSFSGKRTGKKSATQKVLLPSFRQPRRIILFEDPGSAAGSMRPRQFQARKRGKRRYSRAGDRSMLFPMTGC